jgi:uncharacterized protein
MLIISGITACLLTLLLTALSLRISVLRMRYRISFGHGNQRDLEVAIRAHGNGLEQSLLFLLLLVIAESLRPPSPLLTSIAIGFVAARVLHAAAISIRMLLVRQIAHVASLLLQWSCCALIAWKAAAL